MGWPGTPILCPDMGMSFDAWQCNMSSILFKGDVEIGVVREIMAQASWAYYIDFQDLLWDKLVPEIQCIVYMGGTQAGDEVVFEGLNGLLCEVAAMESCGCVLEVDTFRGNEFLQDSGSFIVKALEIWFEASVL